MPTALLVLDVPDVLADLTLDERVRAHRLLDTLPAGSAFARRTAAALHGFDVPAHTERDVPRRLEVVVPFGRTPVRREGVRCYAAELGDDVVEVDGLPVTSVLRTAVDVARFCPRFVALPVLDVAARAGLFSPVQALVRLDDLPGGRGVRIARHTAGMVDPGAESPPESLVRIRLDDAGFPRPQTQIPVPGARGELLRLDLGWQERRVAVEYDGREFHDGWREQRHDGARREHLQRLGWVVLPVTSGDVLGRVPRLEQAVGEVLGMEPRLRTRRW